MSLSSMRLSVCALVCNELKYVNLTLEQSFVSLQMAAGSNGDFTVANFFNYYWSEMANAVNGQIESLRWQGDAYLLLKWHLSLCDGYEKALTAGLVAPTDTVINGGTGPITTFSGVG
jgi:hypothetical protein